METVRVELGDRSYDICIGSGNLDQIGDRLEKFRFSPRVAIVSNPTVYSFYGEKIKAAFRRKGFDAYEVLIPDGEQYKDFMWAYHILGEMLGRKLDRKSAVVALGGGVIGDIACFSASLYMRGISCVQVPTTLLSQVDSSVGGKTGVNHYLGKNMIGTFYQPSLVWIDINTLRTLPDREFRAGMAEIIKYGVIKDPDLFDYLLANRDAILSLDPGKLSFIIRRSCEIKAEVVSEDERESGIRAILNFGHTVGHALETITGYSRFLHGEAVAIGMRYAAELARISGFSNEGTSGKIRDIISKYGLPLAIPREIESRAIMEAMQLDKKTVSGSLNFILPDRIGSVKIIKDIPAKHLTEALQIRS
jgi:3-dehydroquinate synthase